MQINFDMDGTLVDFYNVPNWLDLLHEEDTRPYKMAKGLGNLRTIARLLNKAVAQGHEVNIISWSSRSGSTAFHRATAQVKKAWLKEHLPSVTFEHIHVVKYGSKKSKYGADILFDDNAEIRAEWETKANNKAYTPEQICTVLRELTTPREGK